MNQEEFSAQIENVYKEALKQADLIVANAEKVRLLAEAELSEAKRIHSKAEQEAEKLIHDYFDQRQTQFMEAARTELLRNLTRTHLEAGRSVVEIKNWLNVNESFIDEIAAIIKRVANLQLKNDDPIKMEGNPKVTYENKGRGGNVYFQNDKTRFGLWWEFAGGDALVILEIPTEKQWVSRTNLSLGDRKNVIIFIAEQIIKDQMSGSGTYVTGENVITFYK